MAAASANIMQCLADLVWLCIDPRAVPSMQPVVVAHHIVTILLLWFPYSHPEFALFTCLDGKPYVLLICLYNAKATANIPMISLFQYAIQDLQDWHSKKPWQEFFPLREHPARILHYASFHQAFLIILLVWTILKRCLQVTVQWEVNCINDRIIRLPELPELCVSISACTHGVIVMIRPLLKSYDFMYACILCFSVK